MSQKWSTFPAVHPVMFKNELTVTLAGALYLKAAKLNKPSTIQCLVGAKVQFKRVAASGIMNGLVGDTVRVVTESGSHMVSVAMGIPSSSSIIEDNIGSSRMIVPSGSSSICKNKSNALSLKTETKNEKWPNSRIKSTK